MAETLSSERLDVVDTKDQVTGSLSRGEVHQRGLMHRSVHVLVFNSEGSVLLQKRSMQKDECRGMWDSSCAGHVESGQGYDETVPRELQEELGFVAGKALQSLFKMQPTAVNGNEFAMVYRVDYNGPFIAAEDEIDELQWFALDDVDVWVERGESIIAGAELTSGFCEIWRRYRSL